MLSRAALCLFLIGLGGCTLSAPEDSYTVSEVIADVTSGDSKLDGKVINVTGWLGVCGVYDCAIYNSKSDALLVAEGEFDDDVWPQIDGRRLNIGSHEEFDTSAMLMPFDKVVVRAQVNATWKKPPDGSDNQFGCWDRCDDLRPKSIQKILF